MNECSVVLSFFLFSFSLASNLQLGKKDEKK